MTSIVSKRPREVRAFQAASILYGDWGTSKAYVIGLAFALASYSSFWLIALLGVINILVGINYIVICRCFPGGGGVYASVHKRSEVLALMAAFFLIADYLVTASLSALSGFSYLGVNHPEAWAMGSILFIGLLNYFGPRHTGNLAFLVALPTFIVVLLLALVSLPFLGTAIHQLQPLKGGFEVNWVHFVSVIVGMSGIEAIANTTGVMVLDKDKKSPSVVQTSTPAIISIMLEVSIFTTLFALAATALPNLIALNGEVNAPDAPGVRDYMLRYMGEVFAGRLFGDPVGLIFGTIISVVFCVLLLSAVNTAIVALVSLLYVMSRNKNVPRKFQRLNRFGVPLIPLVFATLVPIVLIFKISDVAGLADLYAVGFVGAIATNLGSTSTDRTLKLSKFERIFMFATFLIMAAIEITLLVQKPHARNFATAIMAFGLFLRALVLEHKERQAKLPHPTPAPSKKYPVIEAEHLTPESGRSILCASNKPNKALNYALNECSRTKQQLYILFIRQQPVVTEEDKHRSWLDDEEACQLFDFVTHRLNGSSAKLLYTISDSTAYSIANMATTLNVSQIIIHQKRSQKPYDFFKGSIINQVAKLINQDIDLIVIV